MLEIEAIARGLVGPRLRCGLMARAVPVVAMPDGIRPIEKGHYESQGAAHATHSRVHPSAAPNSRLMS
jgi:hypothetical protein